jgi:cyclic pyranopterin monophosphate synthase
LAPQSSGKPGGDELPPARAPALSHLNEQGEARMVDVSPKSETVRSATAEAFIRMSAQAHAAVVEGSGPKGEVLGTARFAGIMAAKRTPEAIPMCHPLALSSVELHFETDAPGLIRVLATVKCKGVTGVEMEALHACAVAALTVYDMAKAVDKAMVIESIRLLEKTGGKSGDWRK